jgi:hypothetical protein
VGATLGGGTNKVRLIEGLSWGVRGGEVWVGGLVLLELHLTACTVRHTAWLPALH